MKKDYTKRINKLGEEISFLEYSQIVHEYFLESSQLDRIKSTCEEILILVNSKIENNPKERHISIQNIISFTDIREDMVNTLEDNLKDHLLSNGFDKVEVKLDKEKDEAIIKW